MPSETNKKEELCQSDQIQTCKMHISCFPDYKSLWSISRISQKIRYEERKTYISRIYLEISLNKIQDQEQTFNLERQVIQLI